MSSVLHGELQVHLPGGGSRAGAGTPAYGVLFSDGDLFIFAGRANPQVLALIRLDSSAWATQTTVGQTYCVTLDCGAEYQLVFDRFGEQSRWYNAIQQLTGELDDDPPPNQAVTSEVALWMLARGASKPDALQYTARTYHNGGRVILDRTLHKQRACC